MGLRQKNKIANQELVGVLWLSVVWNAVKDHNGHIEVKSEKSPSPSLKKSQWIYRFLT